MKLLRNFGTLLLSIWLILIGLSGFASPDELTKVLDVFMLGVGVTMLLFR